MTYTRLQDSEIATGGKPLGKEPARRVSLRVCIFRAGLSLFVLFHLFCVVLTPNSESYVGGVFLSVLKPYVFFFELTNHWNFFSPNPEPAVFVDYQLLGADGEVYRDGRWPEREDKFFWKEREMRRVTAADFMVNQEIGAEKMMVNYLCRKHSKAASVRLWRVMEPVPSTQEVVEGKRRLGDGVVSQRKFVSHTYCNTLEPL